MKLSILIKERNAILDLIEDKYLDSNGLVIQKNISAHEHILNDLGDYLPFFAYYNRDKLCSNQIELLDTYLSVHNLLKPRDRLGPLYINTVYEHTDLLLGMLDYARVYNDTATLHKTEQIVETIITLFNPLALTSSFFIPSIHVALPLYDTKDAMLIELLVELYELTSKNQYLTWAKKITQRLIRLMNVNEYGLLPNIYSKYPFLLSQNLKSKTRTYTLIKYNVNALNALVAVYKVTKSLKLRKKILTITNQIIKVFTDQNGGLYAYISPKGQGPVELTANFAFLDVLCDVSYFLKKPSLLIHAQKIGRFWLKQQSQKTGLLPLFPQSHKKESYLDSETDMIVALTKLSELTGLNIFYKSAEKIMTGIIRYHKKPHGFVLGVNIHNGRISDATVKTKYVCLLLKAFILFEQQPKQIYKHNNLFNLLKDR